MTDTLKKICDGKRAQVEQLKQEKPFKTLDDAARRAGKPRGFARALEAKIAAGEIGIIAEIKKASPSAGIIRTDFAPAEIAHAYAEAGAACLSVLTEESDFKGSDRDLILARAACDLPVLRKDFMLDVWRIAESRAMGADCVLLIMAALNDAEARELHKATTGYGMDVLIEAHDRAELDRALKLPGGILGINNRNLKTLKTDLATTEKLAPGVPRGRLAVSESGIAVAADIARLRKAGVHCFLVGESLLRQKDVGAALKTLFGA